MKKSNLILFGLLAVISAFLLWLWYYLGFNKVDNPLDLALSIGWWIMMGLLIYAIVKVEEKRRQRIRTIYVGEGNLFNSEKGLQGLTAGAEVRETLAALIDGLEYDFTLKDFPAKEEFAPKFFVCSKEFDSKKEKDEATGEEKLEVTKWEGSVYDVLKKEERTFDTPEELTGILLTI